MPRVGAVKQKIRHAVVRNEYLRPPVLVVVPNDDTEAVPAIGADAGRRADIRKGAVPVVAENDIPQRLEIERVAIEAVFVLALPQNGLWSII